MAKKRTTRKPAKRKTAVRMTGPAGEVLFEGTDKQFKDAANRAKVTHRLTTHRPNGAAGASSESMEVAPEDPRVPIGEAMRRAVEELGDVVIDSTLAPQQMAELAVAFEQVTREKAAFTAKNEAAKIAKKALDAATDFLLERVKEFTHPTPLPLFDAAEREADHSTMLDAATGDADQEEHASL